MNSLRWLMKHPILFAWLVAVVAILLNFGIGGNVGGKHSADASAEHEQQQIANAPAGQEQQQVASEAAGSAEVAASQTEEVPATSEMDLLRAAREAYWSSEFDNAIGFYTSLLKQKSDSLEYKGELANVYWKQGDAQNAARLFAEIAPVLASQGRTTEALNMKLYVQSVNPELANNIVLP